MNVKRIRAARPLIAALDLNQRNAILSALAETLRSRAESILKANRRDLALSRALSPPKRARLILTRERIQQMIDGIEVIRTAEDPLKPAEAFRKVSSSLSVRREPVPIGTVLFIFESRPNVVVDAFALTIKTGNSVLLKPGRESQHSSEALHRCIRHALRECGVSETACTVIRAGKPSEIVELLRAEEDIDLVIPRGGESLISFVRKHSRIPVLRHGKGVCHIYLCADADLKMATRVIANAKMSAPATCNALETLLIDDALPSEEGEELFREMDPDGTLELRGCRLSRRRFPNVGWSKRMPDFDAEHLSEILNVRTVKGDDEAMAHIEAHGTRHTEAILTQDPSAWERFRRTVDASCVLWNASTRLNDGFELGLGAELGINTTKLHAYGPMGLESLVIERWVAEGRYTVRSR